MTGKKRPHIIINLWLALLEMILARRVKYSDAWAKQAQAAARQGSPVFVLRNRNLINFLCLRAICRQIDLPPLGFVGGLAPITFLPGWKLLITLFNRTDKRSQSQRLARTFEAGGSAVLFLRRPAVGGALDSQPTRVDGIRLLVDAARETASNPVIVPTVFLWGEAPMKRGTKGVSFLFGSNEYPRLLRSIYLLWRRRAMHDVISATPLSLAEVSTICSGDDERLQAIIKSRVGRAIEKIRRSRLGSFTKPSARLNHEVVCSRRLRTALSPIAKEMGIAEKEIEPRVRQIITRMATDFKPRILSTFALIMNFIWNRLYTGLEIPDAEMDKVREAVGRGPLLILPCHKSHVDYLAISETLNSANIMLPHIAAGDNLAFWPMSFFFRSAGAFFIRRSFVNDPFYREVVGSYVRRLIHEQLAIEVFIEGGRSRTGLLLRPKLGLLEMALSAKVTLNQPDIGILPIYVGYDRIIEEESYIRETRGKKKSGESITGLLATSRVLFRKFGKLYVRVGDYTTVNTICDQRGINQNDLNQAGTRRALAEAIGISTMRNINRHAVITLNTLLAAALLRHQSEQISQTVVTNQVSILTRWAKLAGGAMGSELSRFANGDNQPLMATLTMFEKDKRIAVSGDIITVRNGALLGLEFNKNMGVHLFLPAALVAATLIHAGRPVANEELTDALGRLCALYHWLLLCPDSTNGEQNQLHQFRNQGVDHLCAFGLIQTRENRLYINDPVGITDLLTMFRPIFEITHCVLETNRAQVESRLETTVSVSAKTRFADGQRQGAYTSPMGEHRIYFADAIAAVKRMKLNGRGGHNPYLKGETGARLLDQFQALLAWFNTHDGHSQ